MRCGQWVSGLVTHTHKKKRKKRKKREKQEKKRKKKKKKSSGQAFLKEKSEDQCPSPEGRRETRQLGTASSYRTALRRHTCPRQCVFVISCKIWKKLWRISIVRFEGSDKFWLAIPVSAGSNVTQCFWLFFWGGAIIESRQYTSEVPKRNGQKKIRERKKKNLMFERNFAGSLVHLPVNQRPKV